MGVVLCGGKNRITNNYYSRSSFSQGIVAMLQGLPTSEVRVLRLESILRQTLLHSARRRAVGYLLLLLYGV